MFSMLNFLAQSNYLSHTGEPGWIMLEHNLLKIVSDQSKGTFDIFSENQTAVLGHARHIHSLVTKELHVYEAHSEAFIFQIKWHTLLTTKVEILDSNHCRVGWFRDRNLYHPTGKIWAHRNTFSKFHHQWLSNGSNLIADLNFDPPGWILKFTNRPVNPFASMNILGNALWLITTQA